MSFFFFSFFSFFPQLMPAYRWSPCSAQMPESLSTGVGKWLKAPCATHMPQCSSSVHRIFSPVLLYSSKYQDSALRRWQSLTPCCMQVHAARMYIYGATRQDKLKSSPSGTRAEKGRREKSKKKKEKKERRAESSVVRGSGAP